MSYTVVIPARYASQRLNAKPLADIAGKPMIQRVYEQVSKSVAQRILIATDHKEIFELAKQFGAEVCMTREDHASGTDRLSEVAEQLALADDEIIVNVQGDEPLIPAAVIEQVANNLIANPNASASTVSETITDVETYRNPNSVKVVCDNNGFAMTFSRASIPWARDFVLDESKLLEWLQSEKLAQKHIGIYGYRAGLLREFVQWPVGRLEASERLEQLRILENGRTIHCATAVEAVPGGVDTAEDLEKVRKLFSEKA